MLLTDIANLFVRQVSEASQRPAPAVFAELGIDVPSILRRSRGILLNRLGANEMLSLDLGGPLIFDILLACTHLLVSLSNLHIKPVLLINIF